ncbi:competence type IV pilus minor pilin ComGF [Virgibacillus kimchii]
MLKKKMNPFVSTATQKNERGFTFIHLLLAVSILSISLPFLSYLLQAAADQNNYNDISVQQFFQYMRNEVIQAVDYQICSHPPELVLELKNGDTASIEQYEDLIRRQLNGTGHEVYLRDVAHMQLVELDYGFQINITTLEGDMHEKSIVFYE